MTMTDPIADMLTRLRNANVAFHDDVVMPSSKLKEALARILQNEGYITGFDVADLPDRPGKTLTIRMKYSADRRRTISGLKRNSSKDGVPVLSNINNRSPMASECPCVYQLATGRCAAGAAACV